MIHFPVLTKEVIQYLAPRKGKKYIDATVGEGGHAWLILKKIVPKGKLLGLDLNKEVLEETKKEAKKRGWEKNIVLVQESFANLEKVVKERGFCPVAGILFDLGISRWHLEKSKMGFSFLKDEPMIMRYDGNPEAELTAVKIINLWPEKEIERIIRIYGEERFSKRIAKEIVRERKKKSIINAKELTAIVLKAIPKWYQHKKIHPATKTFQALRIIVNQEPENLKQGLRQAEKILEREGRLVVISFHSLEDRIVKRFFQKSKTLEPLTKKPIRASLEEIRLNPSSRSAKLRAAIKK